MKNSFNTIINSSPIVLIDFFADWCASCKTLAVILKQVKEELGDTTKIIKINIDKNPRIAANYKIQTIPAMLLFKKGKQVWQYSGILQKHELVTLIKSYT